jgi:hypothetical protein
MMYTSAEKKRLEQFVIQLCLKLHSEYLELAVRTELHL